MSELLNSYRVKRNSDGKYFCLLFTIFNNIKEITFVDDERDATIFQPDWMIKEDGKIMTKDFKIGSIRSMAFSFMCHQNGIRSEDITIEDFMAAEQELELVC